MHRNSQLIVLYVSTVLNNTTATRHTFALSQNSEERTSKSFQKYLVLHAKFATVPCFALLCRIRELKIETFSGRRQLQPDVTSSFVGYCACSCSPPYRRGPVGDVKLVCLALWRKREYLTFISIRFVAFSNQHFADYRS